MCFIRSGASGPPRERAGGAEGTYEKGTTINYGASNCRSLERSSVTWHDWLAVAALIISAVSLLSTLWFTWLRPPRLTAPGNPPAYAIAFLTDHTNAPEMLLRLPLVFQNGGTRLGVVQALRLRLPDEWSKKRYALCDMLSPSLDLNENAGPDAFFQPIPVPGGGFSLKNCRFKGAVLLQAVTEGDHTLILEHHAGPRWEPLSHLILHVGKREREGFNRAETIHWNGIHEDSQAIRI